MYSKIEPKWGLAAVALGGFLVAALPASALPIPPPVAPGQQDGVYLTDGSVEVLFRTFDETHEFFHPTATFPTPAGFVGATIYLTENGAASCTPDPGAHSLGDCSDGFTLLNDHTDNHLDAWFVSDGASTTELTEFFDFATGIPVFLVETGDWQDVSSHFNLVDGSAYIQSDVPEPATLPLLGGALIAFAFATRRFGRKPRNDAAG